MVTSVVFGSILIFLGLGALIGLSTFVVNLEQRPIRERARLEEAELRQELAELRAHDVGPNSESTVTHRGLATPQP